MHRLKTLASSLWVKLGLSVALLAMLFHETDVGELASAFSRTDANWMFVAFFGYVISQVISALRWCLLARPLGFAESFGRFLTCYFSGMYLNLFAPSTVAGDIGRALFLARGKRRALAFTSVLADRGLGFVALVWVGVAAIIVFRDYPLPAVLYWSAVLIAPATVLAWVWGPRLALPLLPAGSRRRAFVERDLKPYRENPRVLVMSLLIAVLFHTVQIATQIAIGLALGLHVPWSYFFIFVPIVNLAGMLPVTFSGIGIREAGYVYFLSLIGIGREAAIALGLLSSAVVLISGLTGGPVFLLLDRHPPAPVDEEIERVQALEIGAD